MEVTVAERGQITLPKAVRDALGLTKGSTLKVELDGGRIILRKSVDDAISGPAAGSSCQRREQRSADRTAARPRWQRFGHGVTIAIDTAVLVDLLGDGAEADAAEACLRLALGRGAVVVCPVVAGGIDGGARRGCSRRRRARRHGHPLRSDRPARRGARRRDAARASRQRCAATSASRSCRAPLPIFWSGHTPCFSVMA